MTISVLAAFLGGLISLFTPCSAMVIPIFAAAANKKGHHYLSTIALFSSGLFLSMVPLALGVLVFNRIFNLYRQPISLFIGALLAVWAISILVGNGIPLPNIGAKIASKRSFARFGSIFALGIVAGLGATTCVGPILGAILSLAASSPSSLSVIILMLSYTAGLIIPLVIVSFILKHHLGWKARILKKRKIKLFNRSLLVTEIASVILLLFIAAIFIFYQGSIGTIPFISASGLLDMAFDLQDKLFLFN